jgi:hypothetical protein
MTGRRDTPSFSGRWRQVIGGGGAAIEALQLSLDVSTMLGAAVGRIQQLVLQATASIVLADEGV